MGRRRGRRRATKGKEKQLTPYQGHKRSFGFFKCPCCSQSWQSSCSWANTGQQCKNCIINVYPHKQLPLTAKLNKYTDPKREHLQELCEMCKKLGFYCKLLNRKKWNKKKKKKVVRQLSEE